MKRTILAVLLMLGLSVAPATAASAESQQQAQRSSRAIAIAYTGSAYTGDVIYQYVTDYGECDKEGYLIKISNTTPVSHNWDLRGSLRSMKKVNAYTKCNATTVTMSYKPGTITPQYDKLLPWDHMPTYMEMGGLQGRIVDSIRVYCKQYVGMPGGHC